MASNSSRQLIDLLDKDNFVDRVVLAVSANEGSFTSVNPNDAGYGISIGIRQWNQKAGELPNLFRAWSEKFPTRFREIFNEYSEDLVNENWVRNTDIGGNKCLMDAVRTALADSDFQQEQVNLARAFARSGIAFGAKFGFKSELGLALVTDIVNQKGRGGAEAVLRRTDLKAGDSISNELDAIERVSANSNRAGAAQRFAQLKQSFSVDNPAVV